MSSNNPAFFPNADPTNARAVEALYSLLNDVEQRLQIVKASLIQTVPGGAVPQTPTAPWSQAQLLGLGQPNAGYPAPGFHAYVPTPNGIVPVYIPTGGQGFLGSIAPGNFRP